MGKGDKKSRRGKIIIGSTGVRRPKSSKNRAFVKVETIPAAEVVKNKKVAETSKVEHKPKAKIAEPVVVAKAEIIDTPEKAVKKVVKKAKDDVVE